MAMFIFILVGSLGMLSHWFKKWSRGEFDCTLQLYIMTHKKHTIGAVITMIVGVIGLLSSGTLELTTQNLALAFFAGYGADSAVNKAP